MRGGYRPNEGRELLIESSPLFAMIVFIVILAVVGTY